MRTQPSYTSKTFGVITNYTMGNKIYKQIIKIILASPRPEE